MRQCITPEVQRTIDAVSLDVKRPKVMLRGSRLHQGCLCDDDV